MFDKKNNRRGFLKNISFIGAVSLLSPEIFAESSKGRIEAFNENDVILFQGDSITDSGRRKDLRQPNNGAALGRGYSELLAAYLLYKYSDKNLNIYNRGISGNKVFQLAGRWDEDCLQIKPNVLSILIGVNDFWHTLDGRYNGTVKKYKTDFTNLLERTKQELPAVKLIIGEPFAVLGVNKVTEDWYPMFNEYRVAAKEVAEQFQAIFIPYQQVFNKAQNTAPGSYWTADGVHPTLAGAQLMSEAWLRSIGIVRTQK